MHAVLRGALQGADGGGVRRRPRRDGPLVPPRGEGDERGGTGRESIYRPSPPLHAAHSPPASAPPLPPPAQFQHRGSVHCHGFLWLKGAPDVRALMDPALPDDELNANADLIGGYFARLVQAYAVNPNVDIGPESLQPCSREFADVPVGERTDDYAALQMRLQRHNCNDSCMRDGVCRFLSRGDWSLRNSPALIWSRVKPKLRDGTAVPQLKLEFVCARNRAAARMNRHSPEGSATHRSNVDHQPILSEGMYYGYATKYTCKSEKPSDVYKELLKFARPAAPDAPAADALALRIVSATARAELGGSDSRDVSAQEVACLNAGIPMVWTSRSFVTISTARGGPARLRAPPAEGDAPLGADESALAPAAFARYYARAPEYEDAQLLRMAQNLVYHPTAGGGGSYSARGRPAVVVLLPRHGSSVSAADFEAYCEQYIAVRAPHRDDAERDALRGRDATWAAALARLHPAEYAMALSRGVAAAARARRREDSTASPVPADRATAETDAEADALGGGFVGADLADPDEAGDGGGDAGDWWRACVGRPGDEPVAGVQPPAPGADGVVRTVSAAVDLWYAREKAAAAAIPYALPPAAPFPLGIEQQLAARIAAAASVALPGTPLHGIAVALTGPAGAGKSVTINAVVRAAAAGVDAVDAASDAAGAPLAAARAAGRDAVAAAAAARTTADAAAVAVDAPGGGGAEGRRRARVAAASRRAALVAEARAGVLARPPAPMLAAPTAKAAARLGPGAGTIYAVTGLRPQAWSANPPPISSDNLAARQEAWVRVPGLCVDEAFMSGCGQLGAAAHQIKQIRPLPAPAAGAPAAPRPPRPSPLGDLLGDLRFLLLSGDPKQLPPIKGREPPRRGAPAARAPRPPDAPPGARRRALRARARERHPPPGEPPPGGRRGARRDLRRVVDGRVDGGAGRAPPLAQRGRPRPGRPRQGRAPRRARPLGDQGGRVGRAPLRRRGARRRPARPRRALR